MKISEIKTPVSSVTGVGPKLTNCLSKLNIFTVADLLQFYPRKFEDRTKKHFLKDYQSGKVHTVARVISHQWFGYGNMRTLKINISDDSFAAQLVCFNRPFLEKQLVPGTIISVTGHFFEKYNSVQSTDFEYEVMNIENPEKIKDIMPLNSKIFPIYALTEGLSQKQISKAIQSALAQYGFGLEDEIPQDLIEKNQLLHKTEAIHLIHQAQTIEEHIKARKTLVYEELYHFMYIIEKRSLLRRGSIKPAPLQKGELIFNRNNFIKSLSPLQRKLYEKLPFELTEDQCKVIEEMNTEIDKGFEERNRLIVQFQRGIPMQLRPPFTMSRLLQGDVGSGKTLCALMICLRIINWKGQCALMAPTEILARQHAETAHKLLDDLGVRTAFLTGNIKASGRNLLLKALKDGDIDIVIGTHALFSNQVQYNDLQLAIIDEQHRFGVLQRQSIIAKGRINEKCGVCFEPHLLMMSATPIPQSLALTLYGDLDVSTIKNRPQGRKEIKTYLVKEGNEMNAYEAVRKELKAGHQAYFVYPAINSDLSDDNSTKKYKSAEKSFELLSQKIFPEYKCALLHSKIEDEQQVQILHDFQENKIQVLAATTVIEVGVDVPNATSMVIEMADYFGMAQLHQLRGRVGRGSDQSYCFLIYSNNITKTGIERMKALRESTDGFYIAEQDLKSRGPGELNGTMQAGSLEFTIADLSRDMAILTQVKQDILTHLS